MVMKFLSVSEEVHPGTLPDGKYEATWHGYGVTFKIGCRTFLANVTDGVRGWDKGFITIESGEMKFESESK